MATQINKSFNPGASAHIALAVLLVFFAGAVLADPPAGYYDSVDYTSPATVRATVHDIIDGHTKIPYTSSSLDTWNVLELADQNPSNPSFILDVYQNSSFPKHGAGNNDYNREHTWPKSFGFPDDGSTNLPYSDCHMLMLCDIGYNSSRSNKPFDTVGGSGTTERTTVFNNGVGGGSGLYPGWSNWYNSQYWEVWMDRRGDVARAQFYADVRYSGDVGNEPDLILTDNPNLIVVYADNATVAHMGLLQTLIQWHKDDPVDDRERNRNDVVHTYQGNRNPFVDNPEFVANIFEGIISGVEDDLPGSGSMVAIASIYPNPFNPTTTIDFSLTRSGPVRVEIFSVDGKLVRTLLSDDRQAGDHQVRWDGTGNTGGRVSSGSYICRVLGAGQGDTRPLLLLK